MDEDNYTIAFIISPSGLGHITRQISLINCLLQLSPNTYIRLVCTEEQIELVGHDLNINSSIQFTQIPLTPKLVLEKWNEIDKESTIDSFQRSWDFETQLRDDSEWGKVLFGCDLVINDIECIHNPIAKKMQIPILNISNFTWSDVLLDLGNNNLAHNYASLEQLADYNFQLPFSTSCIGFSSNITKVGLLAREINWNRVNKIKDLTPNPIVIFLYSGKYWDTKLIELCQQLIQNDITPLLPTKFAILCDGLSVLSINDNEPNTQDYIAAADVAVGKVGYGMTSEIMIGSTYFIHWLVNGFIESNILSNAIIQGGYGERIDVTNISNDLLAIVKNALAKKLRKRKNESLEIARMVLNLLNK